MNNNGFKAITIDGYFEYKHDHLPGFSFKRPLSIHQLERAQHLSDVMRDAIGGEYWKAWEEMYGLMTARPIA